MKVDSGESGHLDYRRVRAAVAGAIRREIPFDTVEEQEIIGAADAVLALFETVTANTMGHALRCESRTGRPCDCTAGEVVMLRLRRDASCGEAR